MNMGMLQYVYGRCVTFIHSTSFYSKSSRRSGAGTQQRTRDLVVSSQSSGGPTGLQIMETPVGGPLSQVRDGSQENITCKLRAEVGGRGKEGNVEWGAAEWEERLKQGVPETVTGDVRCVSTFI